MTQVEYWILYGLLFAIVLMLIRIYLVLRRIHHHFLVTKMVGEIREVAGIITHFGPSILPDDIVAKIFGTVDELTENEKNNNGSRRT